MTQVRRIFIMCPGGSISGGPEALHLLAGTLRARGVAASIVYYPSGPREVPAVYQQYGAVVSPIVQDDEASVVVIPEVATSLAWRFPRALKAIWWLSVDNYFKWRHINPGPSILETRDDFVHLCQSDYAWDFLALQNIGPRLMLTDYLAADAFAPGPVAERLPVVTYNPKKAPETTQRLIADSSERVWIKLEKMDKHALGELLRQVRIYVDFGPHPGRDRIPREAALCGAVVITGRRGAAAYDADMPLPDRFRLNEQAPDFKYRALALIDELLRSDAAFEQASAQQEPYRRWIGGNRDAFMTEVDAFIDAMGLDVTEPAPLQSAHA